MTANVSAQLIELHDAAAHEACIWRWLQELLGAGRDELLAAAPDRLGAIEAFESVMTQLCVEEGAAMGRMLRARELLGRRPPRRSLLTASA
jgi:hypothetical protein